MITIYKHYYTIYSIIFQAIFLIKTPYFMQPIRFLLIIKKANFTMSVYPFKESLRVQ